MKLEDHHNCKLSTQDNLDKIQRNDASLTWLKIHCTSQRENGSTFVTNFLKLFMPSISYGVTTSIRDHETIEAVGRAIGKNTALTTLQICGPHNDDDPHIIDAAKIVLRKLCEGGLYYNATIQNLILSCIDGLGGEAISLLTPMIHNCNNLRTIQNIGGQITPGDMELLALALSKREIPLEGLILFDNDLSDLIFEEFMSFFLGFPGLTPKKIYFSRNPIRHGGYIALAQLMEDPKCSLETLHLYDNTGHFDDEIATIFANALKKNKSLTTLKIDPRFITNIGWNAFSSALCDETSKNSIAMLSNHTLKFLHCFPEERNNDCSYPNNLQYYLEMNRLDDKALVARRKVFERCFLGNRYDLDEFSSMSHSMVVNLLAFLNNIIFAREKMKYGDDASGYISRTIVYQMVRRNPHLCNH